MRSRRVILERRGRDLQIVHHGTLIKLSEDPTDPVSVRLPPTRRQPLHNHILYLTNKEVNDVELHA